MLESRPASTDFESLTLRSRVQCALKYKKSPCLRGAASASPSPVNTPTDAADALPTPKRLEEARASPPTKQAALVSQRTRRHRVTRNTSPCASLTLFHLRPRTPHPTYIPLLVEMPWLPSSSGASRKQSPPAYLPEAPGGGMRDGRGSSVLLLLLLPPWLGVLATEPGGRCGRCVVGRWPGRWPG